MRMVLAVCLGAMALFGAGGVLYSASLLASEHAYRSLPAFDCERGLVPLAGTHVRVEHCATTGAWLRPRPHEFLVPLVPVDSESPVALVHLAGPAAEAAGMLAGTGFSARVTSERVAHPDAPASVPVLEIVPMVHDIPVDLAWAGVLGGSFWIVVFGAYVIYLRLTRPKAP